MTDLKRMLIVAPRPSFSATEEGSGRALQVIRSSVPIVRVASAAIATVAALVPEGLFDITLCDEEISELDLETEAEIVAISANVSQAQRAIWLGRHFIARGKTVILGGPHVSLAPDLFEGAAHSLVVGELEPIAAQVFTDLHQGRLEPRYVGGKADLAKSPPPRWDLYPNDRAVAGVVQTSRGCPFECNFCDVIQYLGRVQRHKPVEDVMGEVAVLYDLGYRHVSLSDDNFTVYRKRSRALLTAMAAWNGAEERDHVTFGTQLSIDLARDPELMALCNEAGLRNAFIGLETSSTEALTTSKKRQNLRVDLVEECEKIIAAGILPEVGLIVGFDSDGPDCFRRQFDFAMALPVLAFKISVLVAPVSTPLFDEMEAAGRIVTEEVASQFPGGGNMMSNIVHPTMSREELAAGAKWLFAELMSPENALIRFRNIARLLGPPPWAREGGRRHSVSRASISRAYRTIVADWWRDPAIRNLMVEVSKLGETRPEIRDDLMDLLSHYLAVYDALHPDGRPSVMREKIAV